MPSRQQHGTWSDVVNYQPAHSSTANPSDELSAQAPEKMNSNNPHLSAVQPHHSISTSLESGSPLSTWGSSSPDHFRSSSSHQTNWLLEHESGSRHLPIAIPDPTDNPLSPIEKSVPEAVKANPEASSSSHHPGYRDLLIGPQSPKKDVYAEDRPSSRVQTTVDQIPYSDKSKAIQSPRQPSNLAEPQGVTTYAPSDNKAAARMQFFSQMFPKFQEVESESGLSWEVVGPAFIREESEHFGNQKKWWPDEFLGVSASSIQLDPQPIRPERTSNLLAFSSLRPAQFEEMLNVWKSRDWHVHQGPVDNPKLGNEASYATWLPSQPLLYAHHQEEQDLADEASKSPAIVEDLRYFMNSLSHPPQSQDEVYLTTALTLRNMHKLDPSKYDLSEIMLKATDGAKEIVTTAFRKEEEIYHKLLQILANSGRWTNWRASETYKDATLVRKTWYDVTENHNYASLREPILAELKKLGRLDSNDQLPDLDFINEMSAMYITLELRKTMKLGLPDSALDAQDKLASWRLLRDDSMPVPAVKSRAESFLKNYPHFLDRSQDLLNKGDELKRRIQSLILIVYPWAHEAYHQRNELNTREAHLLASSLFLTMRKGLERVLSFPPHEVLTFKKDLISFLGSERYDQRISQIHIISTELRQLVGMMECFDLMKDLQESTIELSPLKRFDLYTDLKKIQTLRPEDFGQALKLYEAFRGPLDFNKRFQNLYRDVQEYLHDCLRYALLPDSSLVSYPINHDTWNHYQAVRHIKQNIDRVSWDAALERLFVLRLWHNQESLYKHLHSLESSSKSYESLRRWSEGLEALRKFRSAAFMRPLDQLEGALSLKLDHPVLRVQPQQARGLWDIIQHALSDPNHFMVLRTVEELLGRDLLQQRLHQVENMI